MSVFAFSRQDGVGKTSFVGFCQVKSRPKGSCVTHFKAVYGSVPFGQAGGLERRTGVVGRIWRLREAFDAKKVWLGLTMGKGTHAGFGKEILAKRLVRENEGVLPRIERLGRVCIGLRQEGLARSVVVALPCPFSGHDGKAILAKSCVHRFC